jgi:hypothetical protein
MRVQLKESIKVDNVILPRRAFLKGLLSLFAAPAIVKVESLMPVVVWRPTFRRIGGAQGWPYFLATPWAEVEGVDFSSLGLPEPYRKRDHFWARWSYKSHPLSSLRLNRVRTLPWQADILARELAGEPIWSGSLGDYPPYAEALRRYRETHEKARAVKAAGLLQGRTQHRPPVEGV